MPHTATPATIRIITDPLQRRPWLALPWALPQVSACIPEKLGTESPVLLLTHGHVEGVTPQLAWA